jgi:hypothetical protein
MQQLESSHFDWIAWRQGDPLDLLGAICSGGGIYRAKTLIRELAIGWCPAVQVPCRPKADHVAIMIQKGDILGWFHIRNKEFIEIFGGDNGSRIKGI